MDSVWDFQVRNKAESSQQGWEKVDAEEKFRTRKVEIEMLGRVPLPQCIAPSDVTWPSLSHGNPELWADLFGVFCCSWHTTQACVDVYLQKIERAIVLRSHQSTLTAQDPSTSGPAIRFDVTWLSESHLGAKQSTVNEAQIQISRETWVGLR